MKRLLAVLVLALPVLVGSSGVAGAGNNDQLARGRATGAFLGLICAYGFNGTSVTGSQCVTVDEVDFSAKALFNGAQASGRAVFQNFVFNQKITADVTC